MSDVALGAPLAILRARWWLVVLLAVQVLLAAGAYSASVSPSLRSVVVLSFTPGEDAAPDSSFVRLLPRYLITALAPDALRAAEREAGLAQGALRGAVRAVRPTDSLELELTVTTSSGAASREAVAALAEHLVEIADADPLVTSRIVSGPTEPHDTSPVRRRIALIAGMGLSVVPGIAAAFALDGARPRVRRVDELRLLAAPVLATVRRRGPRAGRSNAELAALFAQLRGVPSRAPSRAVVFTSPTQRAEDAVVGVLDALDRSDEGRPPSTQSQKGAGDQVAVAAPALLLEPSAREAVVEHGACILVVPGGTPRDEVQRCVDLLERLEVRLVGSVFVTPSGLRSRLAERAHRRRAA